MNNENIPSPSPLQTDNDDKPIAYTVDGQPLYAKPQPEVIVEQVPAPTADFREIPSSAPAAPEIQAQETPHDREVEANSIDPDHPDQILTPEQIREKHDASVRDFPLIQFLPDEYVVIDVKRTSFGVLKNWLAVAIVPVLIVAVLIGADFAKILTEQIFLGVLALGGAVFLIALIAAVVANYVFRQNRLIITNERVFRRLQLTPFSYSDENIELSKIENCSFSQENPLEMMLNYGGIRLSTVGNEKTYEFNYASDPRDQFQIINLMVQETDNGGK
jgi:hypothetical protein